MVELEFSERERERRREHIESFVRERVSAAGADGAVLGLSGGIDSTLTAHLAVEALGEERLHGLVLPGTVSADENTSDAEAVAENLGVEYDVVEIRPVVERFLEGYADAADDRTAVGNARARVRAVFNYLVANHENRLVLGTGNKSEALVGYFTKYGDGAVDCHPLGNLYKTQVRQLARAVGVPERIVEKPPTAGLWEGQTDEGELGVSYDVLDRILVLHVEGDLPVSATARSLDVDPSTVERVGEMHERSAHKRAVPPAPDPLPR